MKSTKTHNTDNPLMHKLNRERTINLVKKILIMLFITNSAYGQSINTSVSFNIDKSGRYMFYLHDRIVEERGVNAVHPRIGEYKYLDILDSLKNDNFHVISEVRPKNTNVKLYADKVAKQIDTLIRAGVLSQNIFVLGAGGGAYIGLWVSAKAKNEKLNFIFMSPCPGTTKYDFREQMICGNFLSIIDVSQNSGPSYSTVLPNRKCIRGNQEIKLNLNKKEGYYYKPYSEWLIPLVNWSNKK
jgi:hypothetical protein